MEFSDDLVQIQAATASCSVVVTANAHGYMGVRRAVREWYQYQEREFSDVCAERVLTHEEVRRGVGFLPASLVSHHVTRWIDPWDRMDTTSTVGQVLGIDRWLATLVGQRGIWECPVCRIHLEHRPAQKIVDDARDVTEGRILVAVPRMPDDPPLRELASLFEATKVIVEGRVFSVSGPEAEDIVDGAVIVGVVSLPVPAEDLVNTLEAAGRRFGRVDVSLLVSDKVSWLGLVGPSMACFACRLVWTPPSTRALIGLISRDAIPDALLLGEATVKGLWQVPVAHIIQRLLSLSEECEASDQMDGFARIRDLLEHFPVASSARWRELSIPHRLRTLLLSSIAQRMQQTCLIVEGVEGRFLGDSLAVDHRLIQRVGEHNHLLFLAQRSEGEGNNPGVSFPLVSSIEELSGQLAAERGEVVLEYDRPAEEGTSISAEFIPSELRANLWARGQRCRVELVQLGEVCRSEGVPLLKRLGLLDSMAVDIARLPECRRAGYTSDSVGAVITALLTGNSPGGMVAELASRWLYEPIKNLSAIIPSFATMGDFVAACMTLGVATATLGAIEEDISISDRLCLAIVKVVLAPGPAVILIESVRWLLEEQKRRQLETFLVTVGNYDKKVVLLRY